MPTATARVTTRQAGPYMHQLCLYFAPRTVVGFDASRGYIDLGDARCDLDASRRGQLVLTASAEEPVDLTRVKRVVGGHLERFGSRDRIRVTWNR
jgi:hypothetical protein